MRLVRGLAGALLWIAASLLGLVAVILCVTVILLPVGIPLLGLARRLFGTSIGLMLPRALTHPVETAGDKARSATRRSGAAVTKAGKAVQDAAPLSKKRRLGPIPMGRRKSRLLG